MVIRVGRGDDTGLVRVHKTFLAVLSPVFRSMLTSGFSESTRILDEKDPLVLNDDDRQAFIDFCKIIHHQEISPNSAVDRLVEVGVLVDKYGCARTMLKPLVERFRGHTAW